ncbi:hypothetical protein [Ectobacillus panaciterrae]|uniref:hypothetical protein n=1 Tax=Ectobacillus panaciterrae TaxID=363872 RepID=UPI000429817A|nr:hypothetical protein [Ectobacillus panaciterrae]
MYKIIVIKRDLWEFNKETLASILKENKVKLSEKTLEVLKKHIEQSFQPPENEEEVRILISTHVYLIDSRSVVSYKKSEQNFTTTSFRDLDIIYEEQIRIRKKREDRTRIEESC